VWIVANDATVKGGTYYPITVKKHLRARNRRAKRSDLHLPGRFGRRVLAAAGRSVSDAITSTHLLQSSAYVGARHPQLAAVMGSCTAGGAYVPAMADQSIIVKDQGTIFLGGPPLVQAATGEIVTAEELGGRTCTRGSAASRSSRADDEHALGILREIVAHLERRRTTRGRCTPAASQVRSARTLRHHSGRCAPRLRCAGRDRAPG